MTEEIRMSIVDMHKSCPIATSIQKLEEENKSLTEQLEFVQKKAVELQGESSRIQNLETYLSAARSESHQFSLDNKRLSSLLKDKDDQINGLKKKNAEYVLEIKRLARTIQCSNEKVNKLERLFDQMDSLVKESTRVSLSK